jgi:hypothetical protein
MSAKRRCIALRKHFVRNPGFDYPSYNNIGLSYYVQWFTLTSGHTAQDNLFGDQKFWRTKFLNAYKKRIAFKSLDSFVGNLSVNFQRTLKHPTPAAYYDGMLPAREQFEKITFPVLTVTGQYDGDELGALMYYRLGFAKPDFVACLRQHERCCVSIVVDLIRRLDPMADNCVRIDKTSAKTLHRE